MEDRTRCVTDLDVSLDGYDSLTVPIHRASTIRYPDAETFTRRFERDADGYVYGLYGTPTHRHLEARVTDLHRGARTVLAPSGQAAIAVTMLALVASGQRILLPDPVYGPVRDFAGAEAAALGIACEFYDPCNLDALAARLATGPARLVWVESPGSATMEIQDLPAIAEMAHAAGALVGCDNTWASPLLCRPLELGADLVVEAISKHLGGHSDLLLGSVTVRDDALGLRLKAAYGRLGIGVSPDDCALAMRGIDTRSPFGFDRRAARAWHLRDGCRGRRWWSGSCIRGSSRIRATQSGSGTFAAPAGSSVSRWCPRRTPICCRRSTRWKSSPSGPPGAARTA